MKTLTNVTVQINHITPTDTNKVNEAIISGILAHLEASGIAQPAQVDISAKNTGRGGNIA